MTAMALQQLVYQSGAQRKTVHPCHPSALPQAGAEANPSLAPAPLEVGSAATNTRPKTPPCTGAPLPAWAARHRRWWGRRWRGSTRRSCAMTSGAGRWCGTTPSCTSAQPQRTCTLKELRCWERRSWCAFFCSNIALLYCTCFVLPHQGGRCHTRQSLPPGHAAAVQRAHQGMLPVLCRRCTGHPASRASWRTSSCACWWCRASGTGCPRMRPWPWMQRL